MAESRKTEQDVSALAMKRVTVWEWSDGPEKEAALEAIDEKVADAIFGESHSSEEGSSPSRAAPRPKRRPRAA